MVKSTSYNIRLASEIDSQPIAEVHVLSWQKIYAGLIPENILKELSVLERKQQWNNLINQGVKVLVVEFNGQIVGFASICHFRDSDADSKQGEISAIYIHPDYWRKGLGKKLCKAAIAELESMGFYEILLWVLKGNIQACKFYESLGFIETSAIKTEEWFDGVLLQEILYRKTHTLCI